MPGRPTVVRRQLGRRLRKLREAAGKTETAVEKELKISRTKLWRIEKGEVPVKPNDVLGLCRYYDVDGEFTDALINLAHGTTLDGGGWLEDYSDVVPDWFRLYVELEQAASRIQVYEGEVVPGPLQTADYAMATFRAARPDDAEESFGRHVGLRMERQEVLFNRVPPPHMLIVLGAGVLVRHVGGRAVMRKQVERLRRLDELDHVEIKVLPWDAGAHAAMAGGFRILDFQDSEDPDVVYVENLTGGRYFEKEKELGDYRRAFELISKQAVPIKEHR
jgi:transcriptional regulator with XRE-family HTH domain